MNKKQCPVCGGNLLRSIEKKEFDGVKISLVNYVCQDCESEGDFFNENDEQLKKAIQDKQQKEVQDVLLYFEREKKNFAGIERALNIPQRTFSKWKTGKTKPSATAVALLKLLRLFPFLIDIADNKYDEELANRYALEHAHNLLQHSKKTP
ncbi:hypothetical protein DWQ65_07430 [Treponema phagedenis]|uniref:Uncharacterized protein n=1 Tax=Treponema phagedenis TaxID=162 RepID=A0A0B7GPU9_TREPH|nr:hypothetical protein [Treponema phagedenis]NVP23274.1 hypothetical protein [Treponema phagedenis]QEJ97923.1 hypothetical protein FUT82_07885 [Treponema phagedenis]QEK06234.1 hypothetical protein FUT80_05610 [Treponema phagedenis]QLC58131.1 hypothetical protein HW453_04425 [Treponema phagedenis]QSH93587.1 hypothetical protein C5O78_00675 [Treponema phagedenis]